ncbi:diphthamide biosynthesis enzyme Dph2 [Candidatus Marsarchaeota G2 archaeon ECH_B_SAG-F08]|uniref:2-(3-amino-3-carboxypropyl)histidine synthase n=1 Tax=Candidatus Marsarchaeota G2 archaeon ECH_B_SAG-F08 TaxID=1978165 RepID=A0A2R6BJX0_9ARCH|nr:MAG: diphthamide biosynthesis enzyme Dph2 [Candidatus Marsarchaeota G2 archaeon ECH_B_SAG-F08]
MEIQQIIASEYDFELERVVEWIKTNRFQRVLLQYAPGLAYYMPHIRTYLELNTQAKIFIEGRGRFGACDVFTTLKEFDAVVHFGHTGFLESDYPILYIPAYSNRKLSESILQKLDSFLTKYKKIGLEASIQHIKLLKDLSQFLENKGKIVYLGEPGKRGQFKGQVVGCDYYAGLRIDNLVDAHIIVAGGEFHALGLALSVNKPVIHIDPFREYVEEIDKRIIEKIHRIRCFAAFRLMQAKKIALVDSNLPGQHAPNLSERIVSFISKRKPGCHIDVFKIDVITDSFLMQLKELGYEVVLTLACTRLATDDFDRSPIPIFEAREIFRLFASGLSAERGVVMLQ